MKLQEVADYLNKLLTRRPEYGRNEIESIRTDGEKIKINFKPKYINPLKEEAENRRRQAETMRKLQELSSPDKCVCSEPEGEFIGTDRRDGAPYLEYVDVNLYRCKKCGNKFDDAAPIA